MYSEVPRQTKGNWFWTPRRVRQPWRGIRWLALLAALLWPVRIWGAFGITTNGSSYTIDTDGGLVFTVQSSSGDITSLQFNGVEYQATDKHSQIASGLGSATVTPTLYGTNYIKIACVTSAGNTVASNFTQYLMVRRGFSHIYMATFPQYEPGVGELRWITRLQFNKLPGGPPESNNNGATNAIESTDVFGHADGTTTSKYYGRDRALELTYTGATNSAGVGAFMVFDNPRESSSGGPFYRDIENQGDGAGSDQEVYNYMNSGHEQSQSVGTYLFRGNVLYGPYTMVFSSNGPPALPIDYSWIDTAGLDLNGWVPASGRGRIRGVASGIPAGFEGVVGFTNINAQYWAVVSSNGTYLTPLMKPGSYFATLYKGELEVAAGTTVVAAGHTNVLNLASTETAPSYIFRLGEWDGMPAGFLNASNIVNMHPQDVRNSNWGPVAYVVDSNSVSDFPSIQMRLANSPTTIQFNLAANQVAALTLRIGITCAYNNGRPSITANGHSSSAWSPSASPQPPSSRSFTVGTYRGDNALFTYSIPAADLVAGPNTISINPISGSSDLGTWLSAGWVYDAIELDIPGTSPPLPGAPSGLLATAANGSQINLDWADNSTNEVNVLLERSPDNTTFTLVAALPPEATNYLDTGLFPGTTCYYRVRTGNAGGHSAYTGTVAATTLLPHIDNLVLTGGALLMNGSGGAPNAIYAVLATSDASSPISQWTPLATNQFDAVGNFAITNTVDTGAPQQFYLVRTVQVP